MTGTGSYPKGDLKRAQLIDAGLSVVAEQGYSSASMSVIAEAVGLTKAGLQYHFGTKERLFEEILRRRDEEAEALFRADSETDEADLKRTYVQAVRHNIDLKGLIHLYLRFSAEASEPGHSAHDYFVDRYADQGRVLTREFQEAGDQGLRFGPEASAKMAVILAALFDGLQLRWAMNPELDMPDLLSFFFDLVSGDVDRSV